MENIEVTKIAVMKNNKFMLGTQNRLKQLREEVEIFILNIEYDRSMCM